MVAAVASFGLILSRSPALSRPLLYLFHSPLASVFLYLCFPLYQALFLRRFSPRLPVLTDRLSRRSLSFGPLSANISLSLYLPNVGRRERPNIFPPFASPLRALRLAASPRVLSFPALLPRRARGSLCRAMHRTDCPVVWRTDFFRAFERR